jgi:homoserine kinase type II
MAVYTEVTDEELTPFSPLRHRRAAVLQGHRRRRRELQLPAAHEPRHLHPDALREARRGPKGPAVLHRPDGTSRARGITCPQPVRNKAGRGAGRARRPSRRDHHLPRRHVAAPPQQRAHCAASARARAVSSGRRGIFHHASECAVGRRLAAAVRSGGADRAPTTVCRACRADQSRTRPSRTLADATADRRDPCRPVSDNVFFLGEKLSGLIDFYFACNDILAYDVAICLNAWCFEIDGSFNVTKARRC